jgi:hypothetical protein
VSNGGGYNPPAHYWCFVPQQYVTSPHVNNYYVSEQQNVTIINNTTVIHNTTIVNNTVNNTTIVNNNVTNNNVTNNRVTVNNYAGGPDPAEVSRVTGTPLRPVPLRESGTPGESTAGGGLAIYRPRVNATPQGSGASAARPVPPHVQTLTNVRPVNTMVYNHPNNTTPNNNNGRNNNEPNTNNTTNNNVNNRTVVNPSTATPSGNGGQPVGSGATRPNIPAQGNSGTTPVQPTASRPPANASQVRGLNHPPVTAATTTGAGHPVRPVTGNIPPKPAPKKVPPPAKKKKPIPKPVNPQQQ